MTFSSLAALVVVNLTTSSAANDENFIKTKTFPFLVSINHNFACVTTAYWNGSQDHHLYRYIYRFLVYCTAIVLFWYFVFVVYSYCCCLVYDFCVINIYKWNMNVFSFIRLFENLVNMKSSTIFKSAWYRIGFNTLRHKQNSRFVICRWHFEMQFLELKWSHFDSNLHEVSSQDPNDNMSALAQVTAWCRTSHYLNHEWHSSLMDNACDIRPQWVKQSNLRIACWMLLYILQYHDLQTQQIDLSLPFFNGVINGHYCNYKTGTILFDSVSLTWKSGISRYLPAPVLQRSCSDFNKMTGYQNNSLSTCHQGDMPYYVTFFEYTQMHIKSSTWCHGRNILRELSQRRHCWWPGSLCHIVISSHDIDNV